VTGVSRRDDGTFAPRDPVAVRMGDVVALSPRGVQLAGRAMVLLLRYARQNGALMLLPDALELQRVLSTNPVPPGEGFVLENTKPPVPALLTPSSHSPFGGSVLTAGEAAPLLGLSVQAVRRMCRVGTLPGELVGGRWIVSAADVVELAEQRRFEHAGQETAAG
jgi:excisionase family DNA binding protein